MVAFAPRYLIPAAERIIIKFTSKIKHWIFFFFLREPKHFQPMFVNRDKCFLSSSRIWTNPLRLFFLEQKSRKFIRINIYETDYDLEISRTYVRWTKTIIIFIFFSRVKWLKEFREIRSFSRSSISRIFLAIYIERQKMAKPSVYSNWLAILSPTFIAIVSRKPTQWFLSMGNLFDDRVDFFSPPLLI